LVISAHPILGLVKTNYSSDEIYLIDHLVHGAITMTHLVTGFCRLDCCRY